MSDTPRTDREVYKITERDIGFEAVGATLCRTIERELAHAALSFSDVTNERDAARAALEEINMMACYASEEDTDSREAMLLRIGVAAREAIAPAKQEAPK